MNDLILPQSPTPIQITYEEILANFQGQFLDKMMLFSVMYAALTILFWWYFSKTADMRDTNRFIRLFIYINIITSLYYPIIMFGIWTGWYQ